MHKIIFAAAAGLLVSASAQAAVTLTAGQYQSTGTVASNNGSANCAAVGLTKGAANNAIVTYPGAGKTGFELYVPSSGLIQLCLDFPAVPAGGINNFSATAKCAIDSINGDLPAQTVDFKFTNTVVNANSGIGTTTITIPATDAVGGGCSAVVDTTIVRVGK
jgi:hypothetical protein